MTDKTQTKRPGQFYSRVSPEVYDLLRADAKKNLRSISRQVEWIITEWYERGEKR